MGRLTGPNLRLQYNWDLGTYFKDDMDENLRKLDRYAQPVLSRTVSTPPGSPAEGDRYIIPNTGATGAWVGNETKIATYVASAWHYDPPQNGWTVWCIAEEDFLLYDSAGGGSVDGSWGLVGIAALKDNAYSAVFVTMGDADYTLSDAEANASVIVIVNSGDGTKTLTRPTSSDGSFCSRQFVITAYAANGFYFKTETYGGAGSYMDFPYGDLVIHSAIASPIALIYSTRQNSNGRAQLDVHTVDASLTLTRARAGRVLILNTDDTAGMELVVPRTTEGSEVLYDSFFYFVCVRQGCVNVIPEDTTVNINFLCSQNYEAGQRYVIHKQGTTNSWHVYKG